MSKKRNKLIEKENISNRKIRSKITNVIIIIVMVSLLIIPNILNSQKEKPKIVDLIPDDFVEDVCDRYSILTKKLETGERYLKSSDKAFQKSFFRSKTKLGESNNPIRFEREVRSSILSMSSKVVTYQEAMENEDVEVGKKALNDYYVHEKHLIELLKLVEDDYEFVKDILKLKETKI